MENSNSAKQFFESKLYQVPELKENIPKFELVCLSFLTDLPSQPKISVEDQKTILRSFYQENSTIYFYNGRIKPILSEIGEQVEKSVISKNTMLVVPSGYGKTRQAFLLACETFSIYSNLSLTMEPFEVDFSMIRTWKEVQTVMKNFDQTSILTIREAHAIHNVFLKQILLKLIVLYFWIEKHGDALKPYHFLLSQLNDASKSYSTLLGLFFEHTTHNNFHWTCEMIEVVAKQLPCKVNIITDEASTMTLHYKNRFLSPSGKAKSIFSAYSTSLSYIAQSVGILLLCGTSMRLLNTSETIASTVLKSTMSTVFDLPSTGNDKSIIISYLNRFIKIDDLDLANRLESRYWEMIFFSRWRILSLIIEAISFTEMNILQKYCENSTSENLLTMERDAKQVQEAKLRVLRYVIEFSFIKLQDQIKDKLEQAILNNLIEKQVVEKLYMETLLSSTQTIQIETLIDNEDFVNLGISSIQKFQLRTSSLTITYWKIRELAVLRAVAACIDFANTTQRLDEILVANLRSTFTLDSKPPEKGKAFEKFFIAALFTNTVTTVGAKFNIQHNDKTPNWLFEVPFMLTEFGPTAKYAPISMSDTDALANIIKNKYNAALFPSTSMKPNAVIPILHDSKLYLIVFGFNYYSRDSSTFENEATTDLISILQTEKRTNQNQNIVEENQTRSKAFSVANILRLHVYLPRMSDTAEISIFSNGDVVRNFNLETIQSILSKDSFSFLTYTFNTYFAIEKELKSVEPPAKKQKLQLE